MDAVGSKGEPLQLHPYYHQWLLDMDAEGARMGRVAGACLGFWGRRDEKLELCIGDLEEVRPSSRSQHHTSKVHQALHLLLHLLHLFATRKNACNWATATETAATQSAHTDNAHETNAAFQWQHRCQMMTWNLMNDQDSAAALNLF